MIYCPDSFYDLSLRATKALFKLREDSRHHGQKNMFMNKRVNCKDVFSTWKEVWSIKSKPLFTKIGQNVHEPHHKHDHEHVHVNVHAVCTMLKPYATR